MLEFIAENRIRKGVDVKLLQRLQSALHWRGDLEKLADLLSLAGNKTKTFWNILVDKTVIYTNLCFGHNRYAQP